MIEIVVGFVAGCIVFSAGFLVGSLFMGAATVVQLTQGKALIDTGKGIEYVWLDDLCHCDPYSSFFPEEVFEPAECEK